MTTILHPLAWQELVNATSWYRQRSVRAAHRFVDAVFAARLRIELNPHQWPVYAGRYRWVKIKRFPYLLFYTTLQSGDVEIMAVAHGRRRPGYWMRRRP